MNDTVSMEIMTFAFWQQNRLVILIKLAQAYGTILACSESESSGILQIWIQHTFFHLVCLQYFPIRKLRCGLNRCWKGERKRGEGVRPFHYPIHNTAHKPESFSSNPSICSTAESRRLRVAREKFKDRAGRRRTGTSSLSWLSRNRVIIISTKSTL